MTVVLRDELWEDRDKWRDALESNGKSVEQRHAIDALDSGSRRAIDLIDVAILLRRASVPRRIEALDVSHMLGE